MRGLAAAVAWVLLAGCSMWAGEQPVPETGTNHRPTVSAPAVGSYLVQKGDTLYAIAFRYGLDYRELARLNGIGPPYRIYAGQKLKLAGTPTSPTSSHKPPAVVGKDKRRAAAKTSPAEDGPEPYPAEVSWRWPARGPLVHRFSSEGTGKRGIGIGGEEGAAVSAAADGRVVYAGDGLPGYGNLIIIKHNESYLSAYAHNRALLVKEGDPVRAGQKIAEMGRTPQEQVLLHFEIRRDGKPVDPLSLLPPYG